MLPCFAAVPGHGASGVQCFLVCSSVALKALGLSEIFVSALSPFVFEGVSLCDSDVLGTRCDNCSCDAAPKLCGIGRACICPWSLLSWDEVVTECLFIA